MPEAVVISQQFSSVDLAQASFSPAAPFDSLVLPPRADFIGGVDTAMTQVAPSLGASAQAVPAASQALSVPNAIGGVTTSQLMGLAQSLAVGAFVVALFRKVFDWAFTGKW